MQKQMDISSTKADKLLKKAKKMNNQMFNEGGVKMTKKGEDPLEGFEFTGKKDKKGNLQIKNKKTGKTSYLLPGGDSVYPSGKKMAEGGIGVRKMIFLDPDPELLKAMGVSKKDRGKAIEKMYEEQYTERVPRKKMKRNMGGTAQMKAIPSENKGLPNLPKEVRNKMGYMKDGGTAQNNNAKKSRGAGAMIKGTTFRGVY